MFNFKQYDWKKLNVSLIVLVIILSIIGAFLIREVKGTSFFVKQLVGLAFGLCIIAVLMLIDYHFICRFTWILYVVNLILLILVKLIGVEYSGATRWLNIGFDFQPSELSKIIMILFLAQFFETYKEKIDRFYLLCIIAILMALPTVLILTQTDLSTSLVMIFFFCVIVFAAGISYKILFPIIAIGLPVLLGAFWYVQQPYQVLLDEYQQNRILAFLQPEKFESTLMYQQINSVQAIGSGKLYGKLITEGTAKVRGSTYVGIAESDFIFSVVGEELGFIGSCVVIGLLIAIVFKCLIIAKNSKDYLGMLIAIGISAMFMFQMFVNIGVNIQILPNTGIPLPFVSYGLSSLISSMIGIGLIMNISLQRKNSRG